MTTYMERHYAAMANPKGTEKPIVAMLTAWEDYAEWHEDRFESSIGDDYVLGRAWTNIGMALLDLLNGDCGRLDCGHLDAQIRDRMERAGIDADIGWPETQG